MVKAPKFGCGALLCAAILTLQNLGCVSAEGYPLYFASFEKVGDERRIETERLPFEVVDDILTEWLAPCKAEAHIVIKDSTVFDPVDLSGIKRLAEQSLTIGSFLTDYGLNMHDLAEDLVDHCNALYVPVDIYAEVPTSQYVDSVPRVFYIDFDHTDKVDKTEIINHVVQRIPGPKITLVYANSFQQSKPPFQSIQVSPERSKWRDPHFREPKPPIIAPLVEKRKGPGPPQFLSYDVSNQALGTIVLASLGTVVFLLFRNTL